MAESADLRRLAERVCRRLGAPPNAHLAVADHRKATEAMLRLRELALAGGANAEEANQAALEANQAALRASITRHDQLICALVALIVALVAAIVFKR